MSQLVILPEKKPSSIGVKDIPSGWFLASDTASPVPTLYFKYDGKLFRVAGSGTPYQIFGPPDNMQIHGYTPVNVEIVVKEIK